MASLSLNPVALDAFKKEINYSGIVKTLPRKNVKLLVPWLKLLKDIPTWKNESLAVESVDVSFLYPGHGEMNIVFEKDDVEVEIDVHVFSGLSNVDVLDEALVILSRTSMATINVNYDENGPCNVYFYREKSVLCVFENVILEINSSEKSIDLKFISEYIFTKAHGLTVDYKGYMICPVEYKIAENIKVNKEFRLDVTSSNNSCLVEIHNDNDDFIRLRRDKDSFCFLLNKSGEYEINVGAMDRITLISNNVNVSVNAK